MPHNQPDHPSLNSKPGCIKVVDTFRIEASLKGSAAAEDGAVQELSDKAQEAA